MARLRVAVLMGGRSSEHEISVASARSVLESLDPDRYEVRSIEIARDGRWELTARAEQARLGKGDSEKLPVPLNGRPAPLGDVDVVSSDLPARPVWGGRHRPG